MEPTFTEKLLNVLSVVLRILEIYLEAFIRLFVPPSMRSLTGEIILVTGSAKGIGKAICQHLSQFKVTLVLWDSDKLENEATASELQSSKARIFTYTVDISNRANVEAVAAIVKQEAGDVTIVINNAGIAPIAPFLQTDPNLLEKTFQVNVLSHFWILREFLPRMIENHHGHIATVCSIGAFRQEPGSVPYFGSKAAVHGYIESLKLQMHYINAHGIKFTTIYPFFVNTGMLKDVKYAQRSFLLQKLLPFLEAETVAEKLVEGIRRGYEYVYCPKFLLQILSLEKLMPLRLRRELRLNFSKHFEHPNFPKSVDRFRVNLN